jgi:hypothetical protein
MTWLLSLEAQHIIRGPTHHRSWASGLLAPVSLRALPVHKETALINSLIYRWLLVFTLTVPSEKKKGAHAFQCNIYGGDVGRLSSTTPASPRRHFTDERRRRIENTPIETSSTHQNPNSREIKEGGDYPCGIDDMMVGTHWR